MKVLFITDGIAPFVVGGMQKHSAGLVTGLLQNGVKVCLIHCVYEGQRMPESDEIRSALGSFSEKDLEVVSLRFPKGSGMPGHYLKSNYAYSISIYNLMSNRLEEFDFIYTKGFTGWYFIQSKKKGRKMPPIGVKFHGYEMFQTGGNLSMKLKRFLLRGPAKWISQHSDYVFSYGSKITDIIKSIGIKEQKIIEIPTGIDESWFGTSTAQDDKNVHFLFVGRYERRKGIEELTQVIEKREVIEGVRFDFIGPIPHSKRLLRKDVIYHGEIKDKNEIIQLMDACHVLICPSHAEGMPNVILEAMARGLFVIATDVGASNVLVENGINGLLLPPGNVTALSQAIDETLRKGVVQLRNQGAVGKRKAKEVFSWNNIAKITMNQIEQRLINH